MKRNNNFVLPAFALVLMLFTSCEKLFLKPQPETDNLSVFDDFSKIFNEKYAMFEYKNVDWPELSDSVRATITAETTEKELGNKMGYMVERLRDGHSNLSLPDTLYSFDLLENYDLNFDIADFARSYWTADTMWFGGTILATTLEENIGYILIVGFDSFTQEDIDAILTNMKDTRGLIIDVRINGGGDPTLSGELARRFTDRDYPAGVEYFKTGPGPNDFSGSSIDVTAATDVPTYLDKPIAILQGRLSYSATTTLIYLTDPNPNVKTFGGFSGGGTGSVTSGYLINGWSYNLSVSDYVDAVGRRFDDGIAPDVAVEMNFDDESQDEIIEAAIDYIVQ